MKGFKRSAVNMVRYCKYVRFGSDGYIISNSDFANKCAIPSNNSIASNPYLTAET
jgi:hypothetical protein